MAGDTLRRLLEDGWRAGWRAVAMGVFVLFIVLLVAIAIAARSVMLSILAAVLLGVVLREFLPERRIQNTAREYASGDAGDRWRRRVSRVTTTVRRWVPW
jgi:NhaP-type Na+/H+ or K+/H+ antiporter